MNSTIAVLGMVVSLSFLPPVRARPQDPAQGEIDFLLQYIEVSGCEFYRNGTWHDSVRARAHLSAKYDYLAARNSIKTAEDFIDKAATKSSLSGRAYEVRCGACTTATTSEWLKAVLARYRVMGARGENESS
jgi:hypothetical protein